jgi:hypothetical protein
MVNLYEHFRTTYDPSVTRWIRNRGGNVRNMSLASRGMLGPNNNTTARRVNNVYKTTRRLTTQFNYMPKLNKYNYIYRGYRTRKNNRTSFTFNNINARMGLTSWSLSPNVARHFSAGSTNNKPVILRLSTKLLKNVKVGNASSFRDRTIGGLREQEVILPPMYATINKSSASNGIANVTNIRVNGKYVRNGSNTKTFIGREVARRLPVNKPNRSNSGFLSRFRRR